MLEKKLRIPRHIAFIMDGNGRWAKKRGLPRIRGHAEGVKATERTIDAAKKLGISYLTFYAFRPKTGSAPKRKFSF